ncbi:NAD dependent epimerase/dehydratase family protein [Dictyocaulus viviparus]|uniref:L-threonine 3-dehydrogenase, mitochondrial n=1 Tax=Dictyocaulus viviparus TaxID=29172 RepID=A0A0D8XXH3_DICVI|nr:NAD dependent epimerase/dehydratase family protein [Dictyocaulus viviparus]
MAWVSRELTGLMADPLARFKKIAAATDERHRVLITGSLGQLGRGLNSVYRYMYGDDCVVMTDIIKAPRNASDITNYYYLDILNQASIERLVVDQRIDTIVHFSALLSAVGEQNVNLSLQINCRGVENILEVARKHRLQVFIPSTIGAFGPTTPRNDVPDSTVQAPTTIYGVSKVTVYAERLGEYYHHKFGVDFRCLRFPGIISATKPGGGTTDYAIEIFYDALNKGRYTCYLGPDTKLPMMYDTDCMASVVQFLAAPRESLTRRTYNVTGFSFTPAEIADAIKKIIPHFEIDYNICNARQSIADSWPRSLNDSEAKKDWGWHVEYGLDETVQVMLALIQREIESNTTISCTSNKPTLDTMKALN